MPDRFFVGRPHPTTIAFGVLLIAGLALRVYVVFSPTYVLNSDEAVVYLMSRHIARGEIIPFYWGQFYGGTLLQIAAGLVMAMVGPSIAALAIVSALFWAGAAVVLRAIVKSSAGVIAGDLAGVLFWFPGAVILGTSVADPGFYGSTLLLGLLTIWWALRRASLRPWWSWLVLGIFAGLSVWTSPVAIAFAAPAVIYAAYRDRRWRLWLIFVAASIVAASAWIVGTIAGHLSSIKPLGGASLHPESLASIFTTMFASAFPLGHTELGGFVIALATVAAIALLVARGVRRRDSVLLLMGSATVLVVAVLVGGSGVRLAADSVRYSGYLIPGIATIVAVVALRVRWLPVVVGALAVAVTIGVVGHDNHGFAMRSGPAFDHELVTVGQYLEQHGIHAAYGSYWAAYSLSAVTDERVTVASLAPRRYAPYERDAAAAAAPEGIVVFAGGPNDAVLTGDITLPSHTREVIGGYAVYVFTSWFDPLAPDLRIVWSSF